MNQEAQAELSRILALDMGDLSDSDKAFLRARRSYLTEEQKAVYAEVLGKETSTEESTEESQEVQGFEDEAPKKAKKVK